MYLVVFRNRKRADMDAAAYSADASAMETLAAQQPGYIGFKSYTADDGEVVAISEWEDEASAKAWGALEAHRGRLELENRPEGGLFARILVPARTNA